MRAALDQLLNKINQLQLTKSVNFAPDAGVENGVDASVGASGQSLGSTVFRASQVQSGFGVASAGPADQTEQNRISEQINELKQQIADLTQQLVHERLRSSSNQNDQILQKLNQTLERDLKETAARLDQV